ncbi:MAG: class I SAM-dependent methyltransferase [Acidobacteria bacterium]|nr:class I SAM-dependent methyltransferase [Acidobacteriota bacterium]
MAAVARYRFLADPLVWVACLAYALGRAGWVPSAWHGHFTDVWLLPAALPPVLWLHERLGWRRPGPPRTREVLAHLAGWSLLFEVIGPRFVSGVVGDPWDVAAYALGALVGLAWWRLLAAPITFDHLAPLYLWLEYVLAGNLLQRCRLHHITTLPTTGHVLVLGPGRGRFVLRLLRERPGLRVTLVDSSAGMLDRLRRDLQRAGVIDRARLVHADVTEWRPGRDTYDAVVSHFFLDCFDPPRLERVVHMVTGALRPDAPWLIADFTLPQPAWQRWRARAVHGLMYAFFHRIVGIPARRLTDPSPLLEQSGWRLQRRGAFNLGLLQSDVWQREAA